jgi:glycosyltransferase involved in cell wall biosynthesis
MRIAVDVKNLALYHGGIAQFFAPLLAHWIAERPQHHFVLIGPHIETSPLRGCDNWSMHGVRWPDFLPRQLRHPTYDNVLFPLAIARVRPDFVFTPYHDVRLPAGVPSALMIHDTCIDELASAYPRPLRAYYLATLKRNLRRTRNVLTVSHASKARIRALYGIPAEHVSVVYNACHPHFLDAAIAPEDVQVTRRALAGDRLLLFYPGGAEFRKNVGALLEASAVYAQRAGSTPAIAVTGVRNAAWNAALEAAPASIRDSVRFIGALDIVALKRHYLAADAVVYPTLCEGFGRLCLECMVTGTPIACSDLAVLREVGGDYPVYFNPHSPVAIADAMARIVAHGRSTPVVDHRFTPEAVRMQFMAAVDRICTS